MNRNDRNFMVQKIRTQYMEKSSEQSDLEKLRELDSQVKRPANIFGYVFGSISAIVMGAGMSLTMTELGDTLGVASPMTVGVIIGIVGMVMAIATYPIYKTILDSRKEKYADKILALSEKLMNN